MRCPPELQTNDYLPWSRGRGVDVWAMFEASMTGDLAAIERLVARDPGLAWCEFQYFTPLHFALREGQLGVVRFLLDRAGDGHGRGDGRADTDGQVRGNPLYGFGDMPVRIVRERGFDAVADYLESWLTLHYGIVPEGVPLAAAIRDGDLEFVQEMILSRPDLVHAADERGNRPIHWAALTRRIELIDWLLAHGADLEAVRPDGARAIHLTNGDYYYRNWYRDLPPTGLQKHEVVLGYLIARGAFCGIEVAARVGWYHRVRELLDQDASLVNRLPDYVTYYNGLPLRNAAAGGHLAVVKLLLERGANVNEPEPGIAPFGGALHSAVGGKHWAVARLLLEHGADPTAMVESSGDVLHMARAAGAPVEVVEMIESSIASSGKTRSLEIVAYEADPDGLSGEWWNKSTFKSAEQARLLLEQGFDPRWSNWLGITMLHRCAAKGLLAIAAVLLEFGADINAIEAEWSSTPLGWAARHGQFEMMEWLVAQGADASLPTDRPWAQPGEWVRRRWAV